MKRLIAGFFGCMALYVLMSFNGCGNQPMVSSVAIADARSANQMRFTLEKIAGEDYDSIRLYYIEDHQEGKGMLVIRTSDIPNVTVETTATRHMVERP